MRFHFNPKNYLADYNLNILNQYIIRCIDNNKIDYICKITRLTTANLLNL